MNIVLRKSALRAVGVALRFVLWQVATLERFVEWLYPSPSAVVYRINEYVTTGTPSIPAEAEQILREWNLRPW